MGSAASKLIILAFVLSAATAEPTAAQTNASETDATAADTIAAQIREEGHACEGPTSARPDQRASEPDEEAWILTCQNAAYRVRLIPDMAAQVERID